MELDALERPDGKDDNDSEYHTQYNRVKELQKWSQVQEGYLVSIDDSHPLESEKKAPDKAE